MIGQHEPEFTDDENTLLEKTIRLLRKHKRGVILVDCGDTLEATKLRMDIYGAVGLMTVVAGKMGLCPAGDLKD